MKVSIIKYIENQIFLISILLTTCLIILGMTYLNDVVKHIRLLELKAYLTEINREDSNIDYLGMVSKYKLHKELYENKINMHQLDQIELKTSYLLTSLQKNNNNLDTRYNLVTEPILYVINFLRLFINKPPLHSVLHETSNNEIAVAYYYENNKEYENALAVYQDILKYNKVEEKKKPIINLHQAFCYSIVGDYNKADNMLLTIIKEFDNEDIAIAAAILLQHIRDFQSEIKKVKESSADSLEKSEKLFKLIAFNEALHVLNEVKTEDKAQEEKLKYLQARCYEETGEKGKSVEIYQDIITQNIDTGEYQSEYTKLSNQRIYVMSTMDKENEEKLEKLAEVNNQLIQDENFDELKATTTKFEPFQQENEIVEEKIKDFETAQTALDNLQTTSGNMPVNTNTSQPEPTVSGLETKAANLEEQKDIDLEAFINKSIQQVSKKVEEVKEIKPIPTPSQTPVQLVIKPTLKPTIKPTTIPQMTLPPTESPKATDQKKPYTKSYKDVYGQVYKVECYDENDKLLNYYIYEYDNNGNPIRVLNYDAVGNLIENN